MIGAVVSVGACRERVWVALMSGFGLVAARRGVGDAEAGLDAAQIREMDG